ncbi:MAG: glycine zipper 2TM domain-containing protein [Pseudomonadota bacterium]
MTTPTIDDTKPSAHHPMMIAAAIAIIVFCLAGTAAIMGWIPSSIGGASSTGELTQSDRAALASRLADNDAPPADAQRVQERDAAPQAQPRHTEPAAQPRHAPIQLAAATPARASNWCGNCGNVESVREIKTRAKGSGVGAVGGAVIGGLLGNQVGGGNGRKLATVAGAVGGAVVGNQVEGRMNATSSYEVRVRLDDGKQRTFHLQSLNGFSSGDRIKVVNGALRHAG